MSTRLVVAHQKQQENGNMCKPPSPFLPRTPTHTQILPKNRGKKNSEKMLISLMMINEGAIRASNCNPISSLATICGLLTRNGGGVSPPFLSILISREFILSSKWPTEKLESTTLLCLPVCLLPLFDQLNPRKNNGECNLMMPQCSSTAYSKYSIGRWSLFFSSFFCATTRWQALLFSFFLVDLFFFGSDLLVWRRRGWTPLSVVSRCSGSNVKSYGSHKTLYLISSNMGPSA
jgi:hypothetical protein